MEKIFTNKNVLGYVLNYLEISDFLNLELSNSIIKSCVDFFYEMKNTHFELNEKEKFFNDKMIRKNSKIKKQNVTRNKKNYISKYLNSFVVFPINEEFDEDQINNEKISLYNKEESMENKLETNNSKKSSINTAKIYKNCLNPELKDLNYFFDSNSLVKQIFYSNEKLFFFYTSNELKIFSQDSVNGFNCDIVLLLNKKNLKKILYNEENFIFFSLSEDGTLYKFYYPTVKTLTISERLEKEKREPLVKKIQNINNEANFDNYLCSLIKLNYDDSNYTDMYLMKNYLIIIDKEYNIYNFNIENIKTDFLFDEENFTENHKSSENCITLEHINESNKNIYKTLNDKSNYDTYEKDKKYLLCDDQKIHFKSENFLNKDNSDLINLDIESDYKINQINKNKYEGYFENKSKTNFHDILVKINKNYNKIIKIDCSESNMLFSDINNKLYFYTPHSDLSKDFSKSPKLIADTKLSNIAEISCGDGYFMILEREDLPPLEKWSETDVFQWFKDMKLDEYLNIVKYDKIKGSDLLDADETFFINNMGMEDDVISKLKYEINQLRNNSKCKNMKLWGWGSNKYGQLGQMDYHDNYLKNLTRINLPEMKENLDFIVSIKCLKNYSVLLTKFGEIFITGNYSMKKKSDLISASNKNITNNQVNSSNHAKDKKNKRDRKDSNISNPNQSIKKINNKWVNVTKRICFDVLRLNKNSEDLRQSLFFKARNIIATNNNLIVFGYKSFSVPFTLQDKLPKLKHLKKGERFPTSDQIIEQILKKSKNNREKILIIYDDAKLKFLETTLSNYIESEVPYHKIIQIKYYNEIIWDRKKRYYKYDYC